MLIKIERLTMGLDMYVTAKRHLRDFGQNNDNQIIETIGKYFPEVSGYNVTQVEIEVMYWRKANAIHKWFVDNLQDGVDNCQEVCINTQNFYDLRDTCKAVLENRNLASTLLPSQNGFFFGSTEYDDNYFDDVEITYKWLNKLLFKNTFDEKFQRWNFYYQASW